MRRTTTLTALLLGATMLAPTGAANAAGTTCRGEAATIVGTRDKILGTDGRDVIVTGASTEVLAGAGDDLICVTGKGARANLVDVDAGAGNDVVDSTAARRGYYVTAILGDGSDVFVGGDVSDSVVAGAAADPNGTVPSESERDVIDTGNGSDDVVSGGPGLANDDEVRTGGGGDSVTWSGIMGAGGVLDAGSGDDGLIVRASGQSFGVDLAAMTITRDGVREATFSSVESLWVAAEPDLGTLAVRGTGDDDTVGIDTTVDIRVELGAGDDDLELAGTTPGSIIDLGKGTDELTVRSTEGSVDLDMTRGSVTVDGSPGASLAGVEDVSISARESTVIGNGRANSIYVVGCVATVDGRNGRDFIQHSTYDTDADTGFDCSSTSTTLRGGSGHDRIYGGSVADRIYGGRGNDRIDPGPARSGKNKVWGGPGNDTILGRGAQDVFLGGPGKDTLKGGNDNDTLKGGGGKDVAVGGRGRDRCHAEVTRSCER